MPVPIGFFYFCRLATLGAGVKDVMNGICYCIRKGERADTEKIVDGNEHLEYILKLRQRTYYELKSSLGVPSGVYKHW
jgi:hypothetical protein